MGDNTKISWCDTTWNPIRGCSRVSEGCRHCYAERMAARFSGPGQPYEGIAQPIAPRDLLDRVGGRRPGWTREVRMVPEHLADPIRWMKSRRIFVNSMSDLFHEKLTNEQIAAVFGVMAATPRHTFQVLTKRAERMRAWFTWLDKESKHRGDWTIPHWQIVEEEAMEFLDEAGRFNDKVMPAKEFPAGATDREWPLSNVWIGVSVENQDAADQRIPELLATPAAVRFLSCEPLLGEIDLLKASPNARSLAEDLDWIISGCESGPGARSCDIAWHRSLRDQCAAAGVPFFLKQAVETSSSVFDCDSQGRSHGVTCGAGSKMKSGKVVELPYLDNVQHAAFPGAAP